MLRSINSIAETRGLTAKKAALDHAAKLHGQKLLDLLVFAYDPFQRYRTYDNTKETIARVTSDRTLIQRVFKKDLRMGLGAKSINKVFPGLIPTHNVMLAKTVEWRRVKYPCWATVKLDGVRAIYRNGEFYFRNGKKIPGLSHLTSVMVNNRAPVLDGELLCPELSFQQSSGQIRSYAESPTATFHIIDAPEHKSLVYSERMIDAWKYTNDMIKSMETKLCKDEGALRAANQLYMHNGFEGTVIKPLKYKYVGKRSYDWMKIKEVRDCDVVVKDVFEGTGRLVGRLGGVIVDYKGVDVRVGSGFSDAQRDLYWLEPEKIIGRTIEIQYHEVTPAGSLRHPRIVGFRDDKA